MKTMKFGVLLAVVFFFTGCASQQDLNNLKFQYKTVETRLAQVEKFSKDNDKKISDKDKTWNQVLRQQADLQAQYTELQTQVLSLQAKLEEVMAVPKVDLKDLEARVKALEDGTRVGGASSATGVPGAAKTLYDSGLEKFKVGNLEEALKNFDAYIAANPKGPMLDNAHFWAGEALYSLKKYEDAILRYDIVIKNHPKSDKTPSALYKQGMSFIQLGDREGGNPLLKRVIKNYPGTDAATKAKKQLKMK